MITKLQNGAGQLAPGTASDQQAGAISCAFEDLKLSSLPCEARTTVAHDFGIRMGTCSMCHKGMVTGRWHVLATVGS